MYQHEGVSPKPRADSNMSVQTPGNIWKDTTEAELYGNYLDNNPALDEPRRQAALGRATIGGGAPVPAHQDITVGLLEEDADGVRGSKPAYSGRKRVWPGALFLLGIMAAGSAAITWFGIKSYNDAQDQQKVSADFNAPVFAKAPVLKVCRVPNYVTDKTKLYAVGGTEKHEVHFTGINWSGMENVEGVPHGLATGQAKLDDIAAKLKKMEINAVRLPLNAKMIIDDSPPDTTRFVSRAQTDLFGVTVYMDMIKKVVQGLARQQIAVMLDIHKIDPAYNASTSEELWYTSKVSEADMIAMYKKLAKALCNEQHYNIIGIDIKNEPVGGCWPADDSDGSCPLQRNWPRAVERISKAIFEVCPNWLIIVEGLYAKNIVAEFNGKENTYNDWFGASLQNATLNPIKLSIPNKVVYAPHFYSPSVYPASYFFATHSSSANGDVSFTEYPNTAEGNASLFAAVKKVLDNSFGAVLKTGTAPVFYGEFGGIYGKKELLKDKTSSRAIDYFIQYAEENKMIGGFSWALNPDGNYDFNDVYVGNQKGVKKPWEFGLYADNKWKDYNDDYAAGLRKLKGNGIIPCFARVVSDGSGVGSTAGSTAATVGDTTTTKKNTTAPGVVRPGTVAANTTVANATRLL